MHSSLIFDKYKDNHLLWWGNVVGFVGLALLLTVAPLPWLMLLLGGSVAGLLVIRWPWLIWPALGFALPVASSVKVGPLTVTDLLLGLALMLWFLDGVRQRTLRFSFSPLMPYLLLFVGAQTVALWGARDLGEAAREVVKWLEVGLVLLVAPQMLTKQTVPWLVTALLAGGVTQALLGIYQFIFRIGPEWFIVLGRFMRASGSFRQPNPYAGYLGLCLPVAASLALWAGQELWHKAKPARQSGHWLWALIYGGATGVISLGLLASWSRGGWLGAALGLAVVVILSMRRAAVFSAFAAVLIAGGLLLGSAMPQWIPAPLTARLQDLPAYFGLSDVLSQPVTDENFAVLERVAHWAAALRMWDQAPWFGVGPGNYAVVYPEVRLPLWEEPLGHAHNIYLNLLAESGLFGLAAFLLFWAVTIGWLWRQIGEMRRTQPAAFTRWRIALNIGILGVIAHLSLHNLFDNLFVQGMYLHIALWLSTLVGYTGWEHANQHEV
ncbi:MAG: O-antigen ligase family protein [Caldilineaceae bacterium]